MSIPGVTEEALKKILAGESHSFKFNKRQIGFSAAGR